MAIVGVVTQRGRSVLPDMICDDGVAHAIWVAWGTGETEATDLDLVMESEVSRMQATASRLSTYTFYLTANFTIAEGHDGYEFSEVGVFNALVGGTMIFHGHQYGVLEYITPREVAEDDILAFQLQFYIDAGSWS